MTRVTLQPSGHVLDVLEGETLLDAACRLHPGELAACSGEHDEQCTALLIEGDFRVQEQRVKRGEFQACQAVPSGPTAQVHWDVLQVSAAPEVQELLCPVESCVPVSETVYRLRLALPESAVQSLHYFAGQYALIQREDGEFAPYSLASPPVWRGVLEFHVEVKESGRHLPNFLLEAGVARVRLPFGDVHLAELPSGPLVLIAAGTGMAQMQSLLEMCRQLRFSQAIHLYWTVATPSDFYTLELWETWEKTGNIHLHPVVRTPSSGWLGRTGEVARLICEDFPSLGGLHVYASGSPTMVYATLDALVAAGMDAHQMRADVFAYAPRPARDA